MKPVENVGVGLSHSISVTPVGHNLITQLPLLNNYFEIHFEYILIINYYYFQ